MKRVRRPKVAEEVAAEAEAVEATAGAAVVAAGAEAEAVEAAEAGATRPISQQRSRPEATIWFLDGSWLLLL
jgi:hypothetical protein